MFWGLPDPHGPLRRFVCGFFVTAC